jgi:hypothetical protein
VPSFPKKIRTASCDPFARYTPERALNGHHGSLARHSSLPHLILGDYATVPVRVGSRSPRGQFAFLAGINATGWTTEG